MRSDRSYGFRMFPETSCNHGARVAAPATAAGRPVEGGRWQAHDCSGGVHSFAWGKMVRFPAPWKLDAPVGAPYGVESELHRRRMRSRWVAEHTPDDCETRALVAHVVPTKNGRRLDAVDLEVARAR